MSGSSCRGELTVLVVQLVLGLAAVVGRFDESVSERTEKRPHGWDGHGDKNNPLLDLSPAEQDANTVCNVLMAVWEYHAWHIETGTYTKSRRT